MLWCSQENMQTVYYLPLPLPPPAPPSHTHPAPQEVLFLSLRLQRLCEDCARSSLESPFLIWPLTLCPKITEAATPTSACTVKPLSNPYLQYHNELVIWSFFIHLLQRWHKSSLWSPQPCDVLNKSAEPARSPWNISWILPPSLLSFSQPTTQIPECSF